jgi:hypothetical protein
MMIRWLILTILTTVFAYGVELQTLAHKVIHDELTYVRDDTDRRYSVWTTDQAKAIKLLKSFGIVSSHFQLPQGQILAVFMNDNITQELTQIVHNKAANDTFADYADSGIRIKLEAAPEGKKYSHVTAVVFSPIGTPSHLGMRDMVDKKLSEKQ